MGENAIISKKYFSDNERFADLFNMRLFGGEKVLSPEGLKERDSSLYAVIYEESDEMTSNGDAKAAEENSSEESAGGCSTKANIGGELFFTRGKGSRKQRKGKSKEKIRDVVRLAELKRSDTGVYFLLLGVESQDRVHYAAPAKVMLYDAMDYDRQVKEAAKRNRGLKSYGTSSDFVSGFHKDDRIIPVITLVVYFGNEEWETPMSLSDMMDIRSIDPRVRKYINDYRLHLVQPRKMTDTEIELLTSDLRAVFGFIKNDGSSERLRAFMERNRSIMENMDRDAVELIKNYSNVGVKTKKKGGTVNVCAAIQEMMDEKYEQGIEQGMEQGIEQGIGTLLETFKEMGVLRETASEKLKVKYDLEAAKCEEYMRKYWDSYNVGQSS